MVSCTLLRKLNTTEEIGVRSVVQYLYFHTTNLDSSSEEAPRQMVCESKHGLVRRGMKKDETYIPKTSNKFERILPRSEDCTTC